MFIKSLKVINGITKEVVRDISFVTDGKLTGVKLIVDDSEDGKSNNVGKSTVIASIDFCLGADPKGLFGGVGKSHSNTIIEDFLYMNNIKFQLIVEDIKKNSYTIERQFQTIVTKKGNEKRQTKWTLNGEKIKNDKRGTPELKPIFFGDEIEKPTFRQLIGKFLRNDPISLSDPIKFYHNNTRNPEARLMLDKLFYNNATATNNVKDLTELLKENKAQLKNYISLHKSIAELEALVKNQEEEVERHKEAIDKNKPSNISLEYVDKQVDIHALSEQISIIKSEIRSIEQSIDRYNNDESTIDIKAVELLYKEMELYTPSLARTFEETLDFHKSMLSSRVEYLQTMLVKKREELVPKEEELKKLDNGFIQEKTDLRALIELHFRAEESLAKYKATLIDWNKCQNKTKEIEEKLHEIQSVEDENNIEIFNKYLKQYMIKLYNESIYVSAPQEYNPYTLVNVTETGTGKEKAIITVFDLAYIAYINEIKETAPLFTAIDVFEPTDEPTIRKIFDIANSLNGQLIIPVLRSKINFIEGIEKHFILELSEKDADGNCNKFFKLP